MVHEIVHQTNGINCIQDATHVATKLRNRLLNSLVELAIGTKRASVQHLKALIRNVNKSVHGLNEGDASPVDRQNFRSFQKVVDPRVIEALRAHVPNSEGTVKYLEICDEVTSSFLEYDLKPTERIFRMYHAVYFLRICRDYIKSSRQLTLMKNFITHNAYTCIEINAKNMLMLMRRFREENGPHLFIITMFDSQTCEKAFRQLRSMGTVDFTRINFTLYDLLHMIGRIEVQNDITYFKLSDMGVKFPVSHRRLKKTKIYDLPTEDEIESTIHRAKLAAMCDAQQFGMNANDIEQFQFQTRIMMTENDGETFYGDEEEVDNQLAIHADDIVENEMDENLDENSNFTKVIDENGDERFVRKSTLIWMLTEPGPALSKDRLRRVQLGKRKTPSTE